MRGRAFAHLAEGEIARWSHELRAEDVDAFAEVSGDVNSLHLDDEYARKRRFMWIPPLKGILRLRVRREKRGGVP